MSRSRISLTIDDVFHIIIVRYFGLIEGDEITESMMDHLARVEEAWSYDSIIDMRRYEGTVLITEIEELSQRWALFAQGRDGGCFTAVISSDPLVKARMPLTQAMFSTRNLANFDNFDQGLDWIKTQRGYLNKALAR